MSGTSVLVIDPDQAQVDQIDRLLRTQGIEVWVANTGEEGLSVATHYHPSLIILSVEFPDVSGFTICKRLRRAPQTAQTPIVMLSGRGDAAALAKHSRLRSSADLYALKPVSMHALWRAIAPWFVSGTRPGEGMEVPVLKDVSRVLLVDEDPQSVHRIRARLKTLGVEVQVFSQGDEGLESAQEWRPDLALVSAEVSSPSGYMVCKRWKKHPTLQNVPFFLLSGEATPEVLTKHSQLRSRADAYFLKPLDMEQVVSVVSGYLPVG